MLKEKMTCVLNHPLVQKYMRGELTEKCYFLNAEGGFGKSTAIMCLYACLVSQAKQGKGVVPIFVDAKKLIDFGTHNGTGNLPRPIEKYIVQQYCGADSDPNESLLQKVIGLFSCSNAPKLNTAYTYYILVDGLNEVAEENKKVILDEIRQMSDSDSVRFFLSSRVDENDLPQDTVRLKLLPLKEDSIRQYLDRQFGSKSGEKADMKRINNTLVEILRVPMYLKVFRNTYNDKSPYPDLYEDKTVRRADILDSYIQKLLQDNRAKKRSDEKPIVEFVIRYFLPALAFKMINSNEEFRISNSDVAALRNDLGSFEALLVPDELMSKVSVAPYKYMITEFCLKTALLETDNQEYLFKHQIWRDVFAAKHIINCMNAGKLDDLEVTVDEDVLRFIGELVREYEGRHAYSPGYEDAKDVRRCESDFASKQDLSSWPESPVEHFLQQHNLKSPSPLSPLATRNLIEIMKTSRSGRVTAKYDDLDLQRAHFYHCSLPHSTFDNAKICSQNFIFSGHTFIITCVSFSPDGKKMVSGSWDKTLRLWDTETHEQIGEPFIGHNDFITSVSFSPDGTKIVSGSWDKTICIWDSETHEQLSVLRGHMGGVNSVVFSSDGKKVISGSNDKTIGVWDVETCEQIGILKGHTGSVNSVSFSSDGKKIVSGSEDRTIRVWDARTHVQIGEPFIGHTSSVNSVSFSSDDKIIVSGSCDNTIRIWDTRTHEQIGEPLLGHSDSVTSVCFSRDGEKIVSGSDDTTIRIWDIGTHEQMGKPFIGHADSVTSVSFSPDGNKIISSSWDRTIRIWDAEKHRQVDAAITGNISGFSSVAFSPDSKKIVGGSWDRTVRIWDVNVCQQIGKPFVGHSHSVNSVSFFPVGSKVVSGSIDKTLRIWDAEAFRPIGKPLIGHESAITSVSVSPNGQIIASGSSDKTIRTWDVKTRTQIDPIFLGHSLAVNSVSFSSNGQMIVSGSIDSTIRIWNVKNHKQIEEPLTGHLHSVNSTVFLPNGKKIISGNVDGKIHIWDMQTYEWIEPSLYGHDDSVNSIAISPDGRTIISGSSDKTVRIWDVETHEPIGILTGHTGAVNSVSCSPDGRKIASASSDGTVRIWNLQTRLCSVIWGMIQSDIQACDFRGADFNGIDECRFYNIIYSNGGIVKDAFIPKPIPFNYSEQ